MKPVRYCVELMSNGIDDGTLITVSAHTIQIGILCIPIKSEPVLTDGSPTITGGPLFETWKWDGTRTHDGNYKFRKSGA